MHYLLIPNRGRSVVELRCKLTPLFVRSKKYDIKIIVADNGSNQDALQCLSAYHKQGLIYKLLINGRDLGFWYSVYRLLLSIKSDCKDRSLKHFSFTFLDLSDDISSEFFAFVSTPRVEYDQAIYVPSYLKSRPGNHCAPHSMEQNIFNRYLQTIDDPARRLKIYHYLPGVCGLNNIIWGSSIAIPADCLDQLCHDIKLLLHPISDLSDHLIETTYCGILYYMFSIKIANYTYTRMLDRNSSHPISFPLAETAVCHAIYGNASQFDEVSLRLLNSRSIGSEHKRIIEEALKIRADLIRFFS